MKKIIPLLIGLLLNSHTGNTQLTRFQYTSTKMGSPFNLIFAIADSSKATAISKQSFILVDSLVHLLSDYEVNSEISRINDNAGISPVSVSAPTLSILSTSREAFFASNGHYTVAIGPLSVLWRAARKTKKFPSQTEIDAAKKLSNFKLISIDSVKHTVYLPIKGMRLDLGGLGKGFIAQEVLNFLKTKGITQAMVDAGGKIVVGDPIEPNTHWKIGINLSQSKTKTLARHLMVQNLAIATSGDIYQFFYHKGIKYSHIIQPYTGYGLTRLKNVTVLASDGVTADWLATACSILPIKKAMQLVHQYNAHILIAEQKKYWIQYHRSKGFRQFLN